MKLIQSTAARLPSRLPLALFFSLLLCLMNSSSTLANEVDELKGKVVRSIEITIGDIFYNEPIPAAYRFVNNIKARTDPDIVRRELLFEEGSEIDSFLVAESARVLRSLPYLRQIRIETTVDGNFVDVKVFANDTWTLIPQLGYSSGDGRNRLTAGIAESNVLGQGNRIEALYREDDNINSYEGVWDDRRVLGSNTDLTFAAFKRDDGDRLFARFEKPFRSLINREAWSSQFDTFDGLGRLYQNSDEDFIYRTDAIDADFSATFSRGEASQSVHRFSVGYRYQENRFEEATLGDLDDLGLTPEELHQNDYELATDRRFSGPLLAYSFIEPEYVSMAYIDRFQRVEDFNLGDQFGVFVNFAPQALGSFDDTLLFALNRSRGFQFTPGSFLRGELSASGRTSGDGFQNSLLSAEILYFNVLGSTYFGDWFLGRHTLASSFIFDYGDSFDVDRQLSLGADNGLRGYDARTFNGDTRILLNLEDRIHIAEDVWELFNFGTSFFIDIGGTTDSSPGTLLQDELYGDAGIGLIVGFPRSSGGRVLRFDLAVPFRDGPDDTAAFEVRLIISGGQTFDGTLSSENRNADRPSVAVGF